MKISISGLFNRRLQSIRTILGVLLLLSPIYALFAEEMNYACRRYNLMDPVPIRSLEFSRDGKQLVVSAESVGPTDLRVIDLLLPQQEIEGTRIKALGNRIMGECSRFSPDGRFVAAGAAAPSVDIWDISKAQLIHSFTTDFVRVTALAFSPKGEFLAVGGARNPKVHHGKDELILFDFKQRQRIATAPLACEPTHLIFSPDGCVIYGADSLSSLFVVDVQKRQVTKQWRGLDENAKDIGVLGLSLSGDGKRLASGGRDNKVKVWDSEKGKLIKSFDGHKQEVLAVALSPDGKFVASTSFDGWMWVREVESGRTVERFDYGSNRPCSVTFSPDSQWVTSGAKDGTIRLDRVADFQFLTPQAKSATN